MPPPRTQHACFAMVHVTFRIWRWYIYRLSRDCNCNLKDKLNFINYVRCKEFFWAMKENDLVKYTYANFGMLHYSDVIVSAIASQITDVSIVYPTICWGADKKIHQSSALLAFVRGIHRWLVNSTHQGPVTREMFPFDDVIMIYDIIRCSVTLDVSKSA